MEKGFSKVIFEVDCLELMNMWNNPLGERSVIKPILDEISELSVVFISFSVIFACREYSWPSGLCLTGRP